MTEETNAVEGTSAPEVVPKELDENLGLEKETAPERNDNGVIFDSDVGTSSGGEKLKGIAVAVPQEVDKKRDRPLEQDDGGFDVDEEVLEGAIGAESIRSRMYTLQQKCLNAVGISPRLRSVGEIFKKF